MFTGLIQTIGTLQSITRSAQSATLGIKAKFDDIQTGESIAVRGVCLSVVKHSQGYFELHATEETMRCTSLGDLQHGSSLNLERALKFGDRLGGHWVSGHIDTVAKVSTVQNEGMGQKICLQIDPSYLRYIALKGSVTLDGVSLTVSEVSTHHFGITLIPITRHEIDANLQTIGARVNVEVDILAKYIEQLLKPSTAQSKSNIDFNLLQRNGYITP